jgi:hypothetical protein
MSNNPGMVTFPGTHSAHPSHSTPVPMSTGMTLYQAEVEPESLLRETFKCLANLSREITFFITINESVTRDVPQSDPSSSLMAPDVGIPRQPHITSDQSSELQLLSWQIQRLMNEITAGFNIPANTTEWPMGDDFYGQ